MNIENNKSIGGPCPLGPVSGMWSLVLKIVLVLTILIVPAFAITTISLLHRVYATKTDEHHQLLNEFQTKQDIILLRFDELQRTINNLPIKEWQKTTERLNSRDHAEIKAKLEQLSQEHKNE